MGGKGSGRKKKKLSKVLTEVVEEIGDVNELIIEEYINRKLGNLISRICYHIDNLRQEGM